MSVIFGITGRLRIMKIGASYVKYGEILALNILEDFDMQLSFSALSKCFEVNALLFIRIRKVRCNRIIYLIGRSILSYLILCQKKISTVYRRALLFEDKDIRLV
jgi:hypothetical protein